MIRCLLVVLLAATASVMPAAAQVVYVDLNAPGPGHDGSTWDTAFLTVQEGVDAATPGGEVWVADGTYVENIAMGEGVRIYGGFLGAEEGGHEGSLDDRDFVNNVSTIDGGWQSSCVVMAAGARVDGFSIINGIGTQVGFDLYGGGFYCADLGDTGTITNNTIADNTPDYAGAIYCLNSSPAILGNTIARNSAAFDGGGILCDNSSPMISGNTLMANSASSGGAIYCSVSEAVISDNIIAGHWEVGLGGGICSVSSSPTVSGNIIFENSAGFGGGGGIYCYDSIATITNNIVRDNTAKFSTGGGGICCENSTAAIVNNTILHNEIQISDGGGGIGCFDGSTVTIANNIVALNVAEIYGGGVYCSGASTVTLSHNDVWNNHPSDYFGCEAGEGDIAEDPLFVDYNGGDFHLTTASPCRDTGDNSAPDLPGTDWDGESRIARGTVDIGADEFVTWTATAPDPQPECDGPLFGEPQGGFPGWVWFSIPMTPPDSPDPNDVLGLECNGRLYRYDKYVKAPIVYQPPFSEWDLCVGDSYIFWLESSVPNPSHEGISPFIPWTCEFKLGRQGWTWVGMPGLAELGGEDFMSYVWVKYPSDETGEYRTAWADYDATPDNWITWGWPYWNTWRQAAETLTPYAPFGHKTCYPWVGYRVWVKIGSAAGEEDPDQVTLIWPKVE